jgi:hypothetical protein
MFQFLTELDKIVSEVTVMHCFGGFAVTQKYGLSRLTSDLDVLEIAPIESRNLIWEAGKRGSSLSQKYHVYIDIVTVASVPYEYESRLIPIYENVFSKLRLMVFDPYDVALSKLTRDNDRDVQDVLFLARTVPFDLEILERRYRDELKPYLTGNGKLAEHTFDRWKASILEEREK